MLLTDLHKLISCLPEDERIRSFIRPTIKKYYYDLNNEELYHLLTHKIHVSCPSEIDHLIVFLRTQAHEDGISLAEVVEYGATLPFSLRMIEAVLRGGKTLVRTVQSDVFPILQYEHSVLIEPGHAPRMATHAECTMLDVLLPNVRNCLSEPPRDTNHIQTISIKAHVRALQSHYGRDLFDVFARGKNVKIDGYTVNIAQLTMWVWMRRFAVHEFIQSVQKILFKRKKKIQ